MKAMESAHERQWEELADAHPSAIMGLSMECPSVGSIGHPLTCNLPCKYLKKAAGCKDRRLCVRCHICHWKRAPPSIKLSSSWHGHCVGHRATTPDPPAVLLPDSGDEIPSAAQTPPQEAGRRLACTPSVMVSEILRKLVTLQGGQDAQDESSTVQLDLEEHQQVSMRVPPPGFDLPHPRMRSTGFPADAPPHPMPAACGHVAFPPPLLAAASVGHPCSCGPPCKCAGRKAGCVNGSQCPDCHQCKWHRGADEPLEQLASAEEPSGNVTTPTIPSVGSLGHPRKCSRACTYVRRKNGCRNGAACLDCHQCVWQRKGRENKAVSEEVTGNTVPIAASFSISVGSIGHPLSCSGLGCKYSNKARGCKDGKFCLRCHFCPWHRYQRAPRETGGSPSEVLTFQNSL